MLELDGGLRTCRDCRQSKPLADFARDKHKKDGLTYQCRPCKAAKSQRWRDANPGRAAEFTKRYRERDPDRAREMNAKHTAARRAAGYFDRWYADNLEAKRAKNRRWSKDNPAAHNAICAKRRAAVRQRYPSWADPAKIAAFYEEARRLTQETGVPHEVDHIVPLQGKTVSGLHVHNNLRVIPMVENRKKHARLMPELVPNFALRR